MNHRLTHAAVMAALLLAPFHRPLRAQPSSHWSWPWRDASSLDSSFAGLELVVSGRIVDVQAAQGVLAYRPEMGFSGAKLYTIEVDETLKRSGPSPVDPLQVLILPQVVQAGPIPPNLSDEVRKRLRKAREQEGYEFSGSEQDDEAGQAMTPKQVMDYYQRTGMLPSGLPGRKEVYPDLPENERLVLGLYPVDFADPQGEMLWAGVQKLQGRALFGYGLSYRITSGDEVQILKRYLQILEIQPLDAQIRQLAGYSLELLVDRDLPLAAELGAAGNLRRRYADWGWGKESQQLGDGRTITGPASRLTAEYLNDVEIEALVAMTGDRRRAPQVREELMSVCAELHSSAQWNPHEFKPAPFLEIFRDQSDLPEVRERALWLLEQIGGQAVVEELRKMLLQEAATPEEEYLQRRLKISPLLKGAS